MNYHRTGISIIYPNPVKDYVILETNARSNIESIQVYDMLGRNITDKVSIEELSFNSFQLDFQKVSGGIYFIKHKTFVNKGIGNSTLPDATTHTLTACMLHDQ